MSNNIKNSIRLILAFGVFLAISFSIYTFRIFGSLSTIVALVVSIVSVITLIGFIFQVLIWLSPKTFDKVAQGTEKYISNKINHFEKTNSNR